MGKPPSTDIFIREKGDEVVQLNLPLLTCVKLLVSADEPEKWASEKVKQREERHGEPAIIDLYKYHSPPATTPRSRKNVSHVKMINVKISKFKMCCVGGFQTLMFFLCVCVSKAKQSWLT